MADKGLEDLPEGMFESLFLFRRVYFILSLCGGAEIDGRKILTDSLYVRRC